MPGLFGLCLGAAALFSIMQSVNVFAYSLGYGESMPVEVTKGSSGSSFGRGSEPGEGRVAGAGRGHRMLLEGGARTVSVAELRRRAGRRQPGTSRTSLE
ncbi:hypothetical protein [Nocardia sp. NPDC051832]|uniref:hypothetical protein n=1 Tax=Nocardia sp. NPDC051832 TaxID=3155673 RepID=UPI00341CF504